MKTRSLIFAASLLAVCVAAGIWGQALPGTGTLGLSTGSATAAPPYATINSITYGPMLAMTPPSASGWTWANQQASTVTAVNSTLQFDFVAVSQEWLRSYTRALPASTGYTAIFGYMAAAQVGACVSDGTKYVVLFPHTGAQYHYDTWNSTTSNASSANLDALLSGPMIWIRFQDTGGSRNISASADGQNWALIKDAASGTFLTETQAGLCYYTNIKPDGIATLMDVRISAP